MTILNIDLYYLYTISTVIVKTCNQFKEQITELFIIIKIIKSLQECKII